MSEQSAIPREKFVIGEGLYTNSLLLETRVTAQCFEVIPARTPTASLSMLGLAILLLGCGMAWFLKDKTSAAMVGFVIVYSLVTAIGTVAATTATYRSRQKRGCAFRLDHGSGRVELPDRNEDFPAGYQFSFALIESPFYSTSVSKGDTVAELQLVVKNNGQARRFALAKADSRRTLKPLVDEIQKHVHFPIHEVLHKGVFKTKIVERAYGQGV